VSPESVAGFSVGVCAQIEHEITAEDIKKFVEITGDDNPLHVDRGFAEKTSFKGIVAHGMLGASFISTVIGKHIPGTGALWMSQSLDFLLPVRIGDRLRIRAEVKALQVSQRVLTLKIEIRNQHDQLVLTGESKVKALEVSSPEVADARMEGPKVAIVTGASRGIGAQTARYLARDGFAVIVNYHADADGAQQVVADIEQNKGRALAVRADVTHPEQVRELILAAESRFGGLSAVVNNASARLIPKPFEKLTSEDFELHMKVQVYGAFEVIRQALPYLVRCSDAAVVNVGSIVADNLPPPELTPYVAAKSALVSLTKSLALEYGPKGVRFNVVSPGMTDTALIADMPEKAKMLARMQTPLRRLADPGQIAEGIAFLLSPRARHITGENLRICGGSVML
jgi:3-oxoacyl-[acyl-carrier protein] reductase